MAVDGRGAFAAITNFREADPVIGGRSRGLVPAEVLAAPTLGAGVAAFHEGRGAYGGMHVLAGDASGLWHASNRGEPEDQAPERWAPGFYALSNGRRRDMWWKMRRGVAGVRAALSDPAILSGEAGNRAGEDRAGEDRLIGALMGLLSDPEEAPEPELPQTGVNRAWERALSAICVDPGFTGPYGVRCSTVLLAGEGRARLVEWTRDGRAWGAAGCEGATVDLEIVAG